MLKVNNCVVLILLLLQLSRLDAVPITQDTESVINRTKQVKRETNINMQQEEVNTFDVDADITVEVADDNLLYYLEAFKSPLNNRILKENNASNFNQLRWFSIGQPSLLYHKNKENNQTNPIHFDSTGFYITIQMLTKEQRRLFVEQIYQIYQVNVKETQITNLVPHQLECYVEFECENNENEVILNGVVKNLRVFPYKCEFKLTRKQRECFAKVQKHELKFDCNLSTKSKKSKQNILEVDAKKLKELGLIDELLNRIRKETFDTYFERSFTLINSEESLSKELETFSMKNELKKIETNKNEIQKLRELLNQNKKDIEILREEKYPNYSIVMLGSEDMLRFFDENGKGFDEMAYWYLCDGRNGTPDLRGRFVTGRHPERSDYNQIGMTGGADQVQLNQDQMPNHSHLDIGHKHSISLTTNNAGDHNHRYYDNDKIGSQSITGMGRSFWYQGYNTRETSKSGNHNHNLQGDSNLSRASLTASGGNQAHENRPLFTVVQYIIYIKN